VIVDVADEPAFTGEGDVAEMVKSPTWTVAEAE
jgi:hypothetical protein